MNEQTAGAGRSAVSVATQRPVEAKLGGIVTLGTVDGERDICAQSEGCVACLLVLANERSAGGSG